MKSLTIKYGTEFVTPDSSDAYKDVVAMTTTEQLAVISNWVKEFEVKQKPNGAYYGKYRWGEVAFLYTDDLSSEKEVINQAFTDLRVFAYTSLRHIVGV